MTHVAEVFTTGASGASHVYHRNVDWRLVKRLAPAGMIGGAVGAYVLSSVDAGFIAPIVSIYLVLIGCYILFKAMQSVPPREVSDSTIPVVGAAGGLLDSMGGGGWGPIVTSTLIGRGHPPRQVIGSANLTEFVVTVTISATFIVTLGWTEMKTALGLLVSGVLAAPLGGWLVKRLPVRTLMLAVGTLVIATSLYRLLRQRSGGDGASAKKYLLSSRKPRSGYPG
jgi:uncharacterized membrane protein YfcA